MTDSRALFEKWIGSPPFERSTKRYPDDSTTSAWPGNYEDYLVELAWVAWQAGIEAEKSASSHHQ